MSTPKEILLGGKTLNLRYLHARFGLAQRDIVYYTGAYIPALLDEMNFIMNNWEMLVEDIRTGAINMGRQFLVLCP